MSAPSLHPRRPPPDVPDASGRTFEQLYTTELRYVYGFLHRLGVRGRDLEDLAHDVFVTAFRRLDTFDAARPVRPWLFGIAFRLVSDLRRRRSTTHEVLGEELEHIDERNSAEEAVADRERRELVDEALRALPPDRRAAFVMYELEGMSVADISEALGTPTPTTYSRLRVAREEFAAAVRRIQLRRGEA